jgi:dihydroxyacid dehydratase/phosphogluconate dehydratase
MRHIPDSRHARKLESEVFDSERLGQTEDESAPQMGTGGFMFTAAEDDIFIIQPG